MVSLTSHCAVTNAASVLGEYPWQAALLKKEEYDNVYVCGGSLIDSSHILTAAHCVKHLQPGEIRARLGEWDVNNDGEFFPNIEFDVVSISIHPEFYSGNLYPRNPHISPVCLPDTFKACKLVSRCIFILNLFRTLRDSVAM